MEFFLRQQLEDIEEKSLLPCASKGRTSRGRSFAEDEDFYRLCYQRDRDRIMYTASFKNLQYKTQVFMVHEGDYYRTRLTHTLEVTQHARTFARVLRVNEDLVEAISLAHDLGHTPFGHAGEEVLSELLKDFGGFDHNLHSLKIVDHLEERYPEFPGLNLTFETREGLARHMTRFDNPRVPVEFQEYPQPGIEAQIVNIADALAFAAHDLEDALRVNLLSWEDLVGLGIPTFLQIEEIIRGEEEKNGRFPLPLKMHRFIRHLIYLFNEDCILQSEKNLDYLKPENPEDIRLIEKPIVLLSPEKQRDLDMLNAFLMDQVYKNPVVLMMSEKGKLILEKLFQRFWKNPQMLPTSIWQRGSKASGENVKAALVGDYLAGLTDRQAMDLYEMMFEPYTKVIGYGFNFGK